MMILMGLDKDFRKVVLGGQIITKRDQLEKTALQKHNVNGDSNGQH